MRSLKVSRRKRKSFVWKVKHYYLISTIGFLLVVVVRCLSFSFGIVDLFYLGCFAMLNWLSFGFLYKYRNFEVVRFAEVVKGRL